MKRKKLIALTLFLLMVFVFTLTGCGGGSTPTSSSTQTSGDMDKDQTLNLSEPEISTLSSLQATDSYSLTTLNAVMEGLAQNEYDGTKDIIKPSGAEKWDVSSDGLTWTFHLRDQSWSDGQKVTAKDYVYAWKKLLDPKTAASYAFLLYGVKGAEEYNTGKGSADAVGVKAVDDNTLEVSLKQPVPYFDQLIAFKSLLPLREDIVEKQGDKYGTDPSTMVFNGPFVVSQWVKGSKIVLTKNEKYWDAANIKLQTVNLININESATEYQMVMAKQIDNITAPDAEYIPKLQEGVKAGNMTEFKRDDPETRYIAINTQDKSKLLTSPKIRQALSISIDRDAVINNIYKTAYKPAYGWIPGSVTVGEGVVYRTQVPEEPLKALMSQDPKQLFQEGLKDLGKDPNGKYTITILQSGQSSLSNSLSEYYQNVWQEKLGITVKIESAADFSQLSDKMEKGDFQVAVRDWIADYNDSSSFMDVFTSGNPNNTAHYNNPEYDKLVKQSNAEADPAKKVELLKQAEKLLVADDAAIIPVYYGISERFYYNYVKGLNFPIFISSFDFRHAYVQGKQ